MLDKWLSYSEISSTGYTFNLINIDETIAPNPEVLSYLSLQLLESYRDVDFYIKTLKGKSVQEVTDYLENYVIPKSGTTLTDIVFQGDFGEVIASLIAHNYCKLFVPLKKLQWKFNSDKSVFSTDLFAHNDDDIITDLYYYEIKTRSKIRIEESGSLKGYITVIAHESLMKEQAIPSESIADFLSKLYFQKKDFVKMQLYSELVFSSSKKNKNYELFFIIEKNAYKKDILDDLEILSPKLQPLRVTIFLINNLTTLVQDLRTKMLSEIFTIINS